MRFLFCLLTVSSAASAQPEWITHQFKPYHVEFETPENWAVTINQNFDKNYIECFSPDESIYFFITYTENEKKSANEVILSYLKVTYANAEFTIDEEVSSRNLKFMFSSGISTLENFQTFIKVGVGSYKSHAFLIDTGYNDLNNAGAIVTINRIIESIRVLD